MYLRHTTRRKDGKAHVYWQLVRSVRRGRKVRQETVAQLGELDAEGRARATVLARRISGRAGESSQGRLFEPNAPVEAAAVRLDAVRMERSRSFGAVWLGWVLWHSLKLDELLGGLLPRGREAVSWADVIAILVIGRLCEPSSELHVAERWYRTTALEDLFGIGSERLYEERLYRTLDRLLPHKQAIEQHLVKRFGELFELDYDLLLYDVTSTYFEGVADPEIAKRGYSRDHRPDCVQVNIALVVTREGMPLGYEIFPGNRTDVTTVEEIVSGMEARFGKANRVWVMDRGMVSAENLAWLNETGRRYVIGTPKAELRRFAKEIAERTDWRHIREDVEVKICRGPDGQETFLLCRSAARVEKERAMHARFAKRIEERLQADTPENDAHFGRAGTSRGDAGAAYPQLRLVTLMVLRSHLLLDAAFGPYRNSELSLAQRLWPQLPQGSLVIVDRGFATYENFHRLADPAHQRYWLTRAKQGKRAALLHPIQELGPGDTLVELRPSTATRKLHPSLPETLTVRAIRYQRKGFRAQTLLTSLT